MCNNPAKVDGRTAASPKSTAGPDSKNICLQEKQN